VAGNAFLVEVDSMSQGSQGAANRAVERTAALQQKRKVIEAVRMRFARFGDEVLSIVLGFALTPRSMPIMIQRLNLRPMGSFDAQLDAVWEYIAQAGTQEFLRHVKHVQRREVEAVDVNQLIAGANREVRFAFQTGAGEGETDLEVGEAPVRPGAEVYMGPERRRGGDRRKRRDRRHEVDAIDKNRRYGGERRKRPQGRRKSDYK
jgi:hypothetical protein